MHPNVPNHAKGVFPGKLHANNSAQAVPKAPSPQRTSRPGQPYHTKTERWDLFFLVVAGLLLIGHARLHVFIPGASALRPGLILIITGLGLWFANHSGMRAPWRLNSPMMKAAFFVVIWATVGIPFALWQGGAASYLLGTFASTFLIFMLIVAAVRHLEDVRRLMGVFAFGAAAFALFAPLRGRLFSRGFGAGGYDPNDSAMFLVSGLPILVFFVLFGRRAWVRIASAFGALLSIYAIIDTQSRGGFIAIVAVLAFMVFLMKGVRPALRALVVAVIVLASIPVATTDYWERMETIQAFDDGYGDSGIGGRRNIWTRAMEFTMANPVTGVGINNFTVAQGRHPDIAERIAAGRGTRYMVAHSIWFHTIAELGIPGFIAFVAMFFVSLRELRRLQVRSGPSPPGLRKKEVKVMAGVLMASLIGIMAGGSFLSSQYSLVVWGAMGIIAGLLKVSSSAHRAYSPDRRRYPWGSVMAPPGDVGGPKPRPEPQGRTRGHAPHPARRLPG